MLISYKEPCYHRSFCQHKSLVWRRLFFNKSDCWLGHLHTISYHDFVIEVRLTKYQQDEPYWTLLLLPDDVPVVWSKPGPVPLDDVCPLPLVHLNSTAFVSSWLYPHSVDDSKVQVAAVKEQNNSFMTGRQIAEMYNEDGKYTQATVFWGQNAECTQATYGTSCLPLAFLNLTTCHLSNPRSINLIWSLSPLSLSLLSFFFLCWGMV